MAEQLQRSEAEARRRKVRKGTHSCWECRRRKIRCQFGPGDDVVCLPCQARGSTCRSQEFIEESRPQQPDRRLAQRLGRLEDLMSRLVDRIVPDANSKTSRRTGASSPSQGASPTPSAEDTAGDIDGLRYRQRLDALESVVGEETPAGLLLGLRHAHGLQQPPTVLTPDSSSPGTQTTPGSNPGAPPQPDETRRTLHALFPPQNDIVTITQSSAAAYFVISMFCGFRDIIEGKSETADLVATIPPPESHPAVLAKRLLQIIICMQQLPPGFDMQRLKMKTAIPVVMAEIISAVSRLVTSDDDLVGTSEGIECLVLQGFWHANAGNLRKAWLAYRRALGLAQLMGLDRGSSRTLKSVDPSRSPMQRPTPSGLWYRINYCDRFSSLLLGLPAGSTDSSYASDEAMKRDTKMEKLEKIQTVIAARIIERNATKTGDAYGLTQVIDFDLQNSVGMVEEDWWIEPVLDPFLGKEHNLGMMCRLFRQIQHFDLLILLHLPYMLRSPDENQYDYSKATCVRASREVLKRFVSFRTLYNSAWSCRHIDYSALVAAMTLLLSYLRQHQNLSYLQAVPSYEDRAEDRRLVEVVRERMQHIAVVNQDKLSQESADIVGQMMSIIDSVGVSVLSGMGGCSAQSLKCLHFNIPYFGAVNIHPALTMAVKAACDGQGVDGGVDGGGNCPQTEDMDPPLLQEVSMTDLEQLQPAMAGLSTTVPATASAPLLAPGPPLSHGTGTAEMDFGNTMNSGFHPTDASINGMFMEFDPQPLDGLLEFPVTADADDWIFQGVDTTYWSLLNENSMVPGG